MWIHTSRRRCIPEVAPSLSLQSQSLIWRLDGFSGAQKVFLVEFSMPLIGSATFAGDMPAIWLLNAQIPLTSQYGTNAACSWYVCLEENFLPFAYHNMNRKPCLWRTKPS